MSAQVITKELIVTWPKSKKAVQISHCPGCHYGTIARVIAECVDEMGMAGNTVMIGGTGCIASWGRGAVFHFDSCHAPHGRAPDMATAIKRLHPECLVFSVQGDGDLAAIGAGAWMNALQRGENFTTVFQNNAGYGMTGGQMAPTTLLGQITTTTQSGRDPKTAGYPVHVPEVAAMFRGVAYAARVTVHTPANYIRAKKALKTAFEKQMQGIGYSIVEFMSACPASWRMTPQQAVGFIENDMIAEYPLGVFKDVDKIE